jgi:cytosine/uracil/thiamine/allantoin permease
VRFWLSGPRILGIRPGISFGLAEIRQLGIIGSTALAILRFVVAIVLTGIVGVDFWILQQLL